MYLRTSEHEEAVRSIEWAASQAKELANDPYMWKWVLISLHNAVQGFMVLALWNGNGLLTRSDESAAAWLKEHRSNKLEKKYPAERLDSFLKLFAKCKDENNFNYCGSRQFRSTALHDDSFKALNDYRNEFIHFTPKGWSLEYSDLPILVGHALDLVSFFGWQSTAILWHERSHRIRARWAHRSLRRTMATLGTKYGAL
jgi:hypothetical protein